VPGGGRSWLYILAAADPEYLIREPARTPPSP
jgi:hypothetical protein